MRILVNSLSFWTTFAPHFLPLPKLSGPERAETNASVSGVSPSVGIVTLTETAMSTLSVPRIIDVTEVFQRNLTLDTAKNCFLVYFIAKRALKLWRHVRARGIFRSLRELYVSIAQVFPISLPLTPSPSIETLSFVLENLSAYY
jgi:hypothetical protein